MVYQTTLKYPHNITVIGRTPDKFITQSGFDLYAALEFQAWLEKLGVLQPELISPISLLYLPEEEWKIFTAKQPNLKSYQEYIDIIELWAGQTIAFVFIINNKKYW